MPFVQLGGDREESHPLSHNLHSFGKKPAILPVQIQEFLSISQRKQLLIRTYQVYKCVDNRDFVCFSRPSMAMTDILPKQLRGFIWASGVKSFWSTVT